MALDGDEASGVATFYIAGNRIQFPFACRGKVGLTSPEEDTARDSKDLRASSGWGSRSSASQLRLEIADL